MKLAAMPSTRSTAIWLVIEGSLSAVSRVSSARSNERSDLTHKRTNHELRPPYERHRARPRAGGIRQSFPWPAVAGRFRYTGAIRAAVCRTFGPIAAP